LSEIGDPMTTTPQKLDNRYKESKAAELLTHQGKTTAGIIGMGRVLTEVKAALPHGEYTEWMRTHFRFSNATSLRYRRSFAFATSTDDFGSLKLEILALYLCGEIHEAISKPVKDPVHRTAMEAGLRAILKAARKRLIDGVEALRIFNDAFTSKHAELEVANAAARNESVESTTEPEAAPAEPDQSEADIDDSMTCDGNDEPVLILVPVSRQFPEALQMVMREESDNQWIEQAKVIGETEFRKFAAHVNAALKTFDATSNVVKLKADRAEAKAKSK
jgi:Protein of unknown function (DUF3102)